MRLLSVLAGIAACAGPAVPMDRHVAPACISSLPSPDGAAVYGRVVGFDGVPMVGAMIIARAWHYTSGDGFGYVQELKSTVDASGHYSVLGPPFSYRIEVALGGRIVLAAHIDGDRLPRRVDFAIDTARVEGTVDLLDAIFVDRLPAGAYCKWECPFGYAPMEEWWRRERPCPRGTQLVTDINAAQMRTSVSCQTPGGELHGPFSSWMPSAAGDAWLRWSGWHSEGKECGVWRKPAAPARATE
jgi:hypothetical protein